MVERLALGMERFGWCRKQSVWWLRGARPISIEFLLENVGKVLPQLTWAMYGTMQNGSCELELFVRVALNHQPGTYGSGGIRLFN